MMLARADEVLASHRPPAQPQDTVDTPALRILAERSRRVPYLRAKQEQAFRALWSKNLPIVVYGLQDCLQLECWSPDSFVASHGQEKCLMLDSGRPNPRHVTVGDFFAEFMKDDGERGSVVRMKVSLYLSGCRLSTRVRPSTRIGRLQRISPVPSSNSSRSLLNRYRCRRIHGMTGSAT